MRKIKTVSIIPYKLYPSQKYSQSQGSQLKQSNGESTNKKFVFIHIIVIIQLFSSLRAWLCGCRTEIEVTSPAHRRESDSSYTIQCTALYANPTTPAKSFALSYNWNLLENNLGNLRAQPCNPFLSSKLGL